MRCLLNIQVRISSRQLVIGLELKQLELDM